MFFKTQSIINNIKNLFFPKICLSCNNFLYPNENYICTNCRHELPLIDSYKIGSNPLEKILQGRVEVEKISAFLWYHKNSIVQQLIHNLKYKNHQEIGVIIGNWYGNELYESKFYGNVDIVLPVPLHLKKMKKRKYNQVAEFSKCIAQSIKADYKDDILIQVKETTTQTRKGRKDRWDQKKDAYSINKGVNYNNLHLLLVDDVITTGSTLEACIKTLKKYQNCKISIAAIAITA